MSLGLSTIFVFLEVIGSAACTAASGPKTQSLIVFKLAEETSAENQAIFALYCF